MNIGVFGAGSLGMFVGGRLANSGESVTMVGRLGSEIAQHGLTLTDIHGGRVALAPARVPYTERIERLSGCDVVLVTVKSMATERAGALLAPVLRRSACVISLQNGTSNGTTLRRTLPGHPVLEAIATFNVVRKGPGALHQGTAGRVVIENNSVGRRIAASFIKAGIRAALDDDIRPVLWSKLLFNLNNPINALAGISLREELAQRAFRSVLANSMREGLAALRAAGIRPRRIGGWIPRLTPPILSLPDCLYSRLADVLLPIDPHARSSMWEDLDRRRPTEIEHLNGAIVELGTRQGTPTPVNRRVRDLVLAAEMKRQGSPMLRGEDLLAEVSRVA